MKKTLLLCLALLLCVGGALGEDGDWDDMCDSWRIYYVPSNVPIDSDEFDV